MSWQDVLEVALLVVLLAITVPPLGTYIAAVHGSRDDGSAPGDRVFGPLERGLYRICRVDARREQRWNVYAISLLAFSLVSLRFLYAMLRLQGSLPVRMRARPTSGQPSLAVTISDETGSATAVWTGRRAIGGITLGRRLRVEGVATHVGSQLEFTNPSYTLLP